MDALTHCKAMEAFCRQWARMEGEAADFWLGEAQLWRDRQAAVAGKPKRAPARTAPAQTAKVRSRKVAS
jgi:hypothetical protein